MKVAIRIYLLIGLLEPMLITMSTDSVIHSPIILIIVSVNLTRLSLYDDILHNMQAKQFFFFNNGRI